MEEMVMRAVLHLKMLKKIMNLFTLKLETEKRIKKLWLYEIP